MLIAYKGFSWDLTCLGYQYSETGLNETSTANCRRNGFHCAENPLDCLTYYPDITSSVYYVVEAGGELHEEEGDSKIACTKIRLIKKLSPLELLLEGAAYMVRFPKRQWSQNVQRETGRAFYKYVVVRGKDPIAAGVRGSILILLQEEKDSDDIKAISAYIAGQDGCLENEWYDIDGQRRKAA